jgi:hypothetical protein
MKNILALINHALADLLFSIANETISTLCDDAGINNRHPFVHANLECALEDLRDAESDWNSTFHPLDMDGEDLHAHGDYLGDLEREGE